MISRSASPAPSPNSIPAKTKSTQRDQKPAGKPVLMAPTKLEIAAMGFLAYGIIRIFQALFDRAQKERQNP